MEKYKAILKSNDKIILNNSYMCNNLDNMSPDDTTIPDDEYEKTVLDGDEIYNVEETETKVNRILLEYPPHPLILPWEKENLECQIDYMEYCTEPDEDEQKKIKKLKHNLRTKELKPNAEIFETIERQIETDPTYNWFKMTTANPNYHCNITIKDATPYYIFNMMYEDKNWRRWFNTSIKSIGAKMRRYQNKYHSIKSLNNTI